MNLFRVEYDYRRCDGTVAEGIQFIVAKTIEDAIRLFRVQPANTISDIKTVVMLHSNVIVDPQRGSALGHYQQG